MISIKINNIKFWVKSNLSVLEACNFVGINVPRFCYSENLSIAGNCRMCLVEIFNAPKPVASCALPISPNISIFTNSPAVKKARENVLEILLLNHPLDCPICDQGGECDLQDQTQIFGNNTSRLFFSKNTVDDKFYGSFIKTIMTRCIHCTRCVRFSEEIAGVPSYGTLNRGKNTEIGYYTETLFNSDISGNVIDLCPVGALTSKVYAFKARPWELKSQETIDGTNGLGTNILVNTKEGEIVRIQPKLDGFQKNQYITDKIRFSFDFLIHNRIKKIFIKSTKKEFENISSDIFIVQLKEILKTEKITVIVNDGVDSELIIKLKNYKNVDIISLDQLENLNLYTDSVTDKSFDIDALETKTCFLISINPNIECSLLNTKIRLKYLNNVINIVAFGNYAKLNYPVNFLNLNSKNLVSLIEGKKKNSLNFLFGKPSLFIVGNLLKKRMNNSNIFLNFIKKKSPRSIIINPTNTVNTEGLKYLGVSSLNSKILEKNKNVFFFNISDNIITRKILRNLDKKEIFWFNTHGSSIALNSKYIIPSLSFYEEEQFFLTYDKIFKKTNSIIPNVNIVSLKNMINANRIDQNKYLSLYNELLYKHYSKKSLIFSFIQNTYLFFEKKTKIIYYYPNKLSTENSFLSNNLCKNSIYLNQRSQEILKTFTSF